MINNLIPKIKTKCWDFIVSKTRGKNFYFKIYYSYWHYKLNSNTKSNLEKNYFTAVPNVGAGIGHQMANWIAGYWYAQTFNLKYAYSPFSSKEWDSFLGFRENEITAEELTKTKGYKKILLPLFHEFNNKELKLVKSIIKSYENKKVVFVAEQDQYYRDQFGIMDTLQEKFHNAPARKKEKLIYKKEEFNIAIHIRRGDIIVSEKKMTSNLEMRFQSNDYFENVLSNILKNINSVKPISIYLFSQGEKQDFSNLRKFDNIKFNLDMSAKDTFLHLVYADLLVTSKSSFSYKPALLSKGIKISPQNFWHNYPKIKNWILADDEGNFKVDYLKKLS